MNDSALSVVVFGAGGRAGRAAVGEARRRGFRGTVVAVSHDRYFAEAVGFDTRWRVADGLLRAEE